jgi:hypothetical protein
MALLISVGLRPNSAKLRSHRLAHRDISLRGSLIVLMNAAQVETLD